MIIHCLSCGKAISSQLCNCPYCYTEITDLTKELNGIVEKEDIKERMKGLMFGLVHNK